MTPMTSKLFRRAVRYGMAGEEVLGEACVLILDAVDLGTAVAGVVRTTWGAGWDCCNLCSLLTMICCDCLQFA